MNIGSEMTEYWPGITDMADFKVKIKIARGSQKKVNLNTQSKT